MGLPLIPRLLWLAKGLAGCGKQSLGASSSCRIACNSNLFCKVFGARNLLAGIDTELSTRAIQVRPQIIKERIEQEHYCVRSF